MPPIAQEKYCPLYKIDYLITKKSYTEKRTQRSIHLEIMALLGISRQTLWRARRVQVGESGAPLSTDDLIKLKDYFNCSLDDLVVASPTPGQPDVSPEVAGSFSDSNSTES